MYGWAQAQDMPTTFGIKWIKEGKWFKKSIMTSQTSFLAQQWLYWIQEQPVCYDNGRKIQLEHKYHRGEMDFHCWFPDGYINKNGEHVFFEFLGCYFHPGCCVPDNKIKNAHRRRVDWNRKKKWLSDRGTLHVIRECEWVNQLKEMDQFPSTDMPRILLRDTEESLLQAIDNESVFGFIQADVLTPIEIIEDMIDGEFLFPPVIKSMEITEDIISEYMRKRMVDCDRKANPTIIQCFNGKQMLIMTSLAKFYMDRGMIISNITKFIQYIPKKTLAPFTEKVYKMRCEAEKNAEEKDMAKSMTAKLFGNSGNNISYHTTISYHITSVSYEYTSILYQYISEAYQYIGILYRYIIYHFISYNYDMR